MIVRPLPSPATDVRDHTVTPAFILLVDHADESRRNLSGMLVRAGHQVTSASDGADALRWLGTARFDLAFVTVRMPVMDGLELTRRMRASEDRAVAVLPVIALSVAANVEDRSHAEAAGMDVYVTTPTPSKAIIGAVAEVRAGRPSNRAFCRSRNVIDRAIYDEQRATFGDGRIGSFLSLLRDELGRRSAALHEARRLGDRAELSRTAHAIASASGNLGFIEVMAFCRRLEGEIAAMPADRIDALLDELHRMIQATLDTIDILRSEIAANA